MIIISIKVHPGTPVPDLNFYFEAIHDGVLTARAWVYEYYPSNLSLKKHFLITFILYTHMVFN